MLFVGRKRSGKKKDKLKAMDTGAYTNPRPGQYLMFEHSHITAREERTKQKKKAFDVIGGMFVLKLYLLEVK